MGFRNMCTSCDSRKISIKKKFAIFSSVGLVIAITTYLAFTTTNNPTIAAALPALLSLSVCPVMCAVVGGLMWFSSRFSTGNDKHKGSRGHNMPLAINTKDEAPWRNQHRLRHTNRNRNENPEL